MNHSKKRPASIQEALEFWCESFPERRDMHPVDGEKSAACDAAGELNAMGPNTAKSRDSGETHPRLAIQSHLYM